jgi:ABC-type dipeptide/oligopeptide/nickel transport system permease component
MATGDLGQSVYNNSQPAWDLVVERMPATLELVLRFSCIRVG